MEKILNQNVIIFRLTKINEKLDGPTQNPQSILSEQ